MAPILETIGLGLRYPGFELAGIDLRLDRGSVLGLIGPSGAGKTTLMKLIMGQVAPSSGTLTVAGLTHPGDLKEIRSLVGYVPEDPPFLADRRVEQIADFAAPYFPRWSGARFDALLRDFEIDRRARISSLSRGRKSLLSLALALSHEASLLLLDEPAAGLDARRRRQVLRLIAEFVADGDGAAMITTHQTDGLAPLADRMAILDRGRLVLAGETEDLLASWKWIHYRGGALTEELEATMICRESGPVGNRGLIRTYAELHDQLEAARATGDVQVANATIDDILVSLTGGQ